MPNVIRVNDPTSHGGQVIESGAPHITVDGKAVALVGDKCMCPISGHQNCSIVSGNAQHTVNGKAVAYDGDKTSCGAVLISTTGNFTST
ncbi:PAAR domain-containing protein [Duganella aceris]|uniref:PAAR domain-containing protein n=1 Tax=Duganella aceris TaxID=2703883 RepID=A0ABX0FW86_9BURK|nr:PAAR domain-containing protein [Duganella aceris]NGZ88635.1 PAAR domain-containing protein [Duganella aceris]